MSKSTTRSRLLIRLSSLGDVIIATSALEVFSDTEKVDWVTTKHYSELLAEHPKIRQVLVFDRTTGLKGWIRFCRECWERNYSEVLDLHGNLRTLIMRGLFLVWGLQAPLTKPVWKKISKQRLRLYGYYLFKGLWPKKFRPMPWVKKFAQFSGGTGDERPNLTHLMRGINSLPFEIKSLPNPSKNYLCIMPSSKWNGKKWPIANYVELLKKLSTFPVILGSSSDLESIELCKSLNEAKVPHYSGVGKWNLTQTASVLAFSQGYLGSDTGLAHFAEALGVPARVLFGPTAPDMGFGPWRENSRAIQMPISCRPCGKDGRFCYRILNRYGCLKDLSPEFVLEKISGVNSNPNLPTKNKSRSREGLKNIYRWVNSQGIEKWILPFIVSEKRIKKARELQSLSIQTQSSSIRIWFHAASAGELESLWPLIILASQGRMDVDAFLKTAANGVPPSDAPVNSAAETSRSAPSDLFPKTEIVVTVLSESAWNALEKLNARLDELEARVLFIGYSPWEGSWKKQLDQIRPHFFVTVKYEAWPDLWISLQERKIPLVIVGARVRKSLKIAKGMTEFLAGELPVLKFFPCDSGDVADLRNLFPKAKLELVSEPRWERVFERSRLGHSRAMELTGSCRELPRPWGILGNAWLEDLELFQSLFGSISGTLWIVPHQIEGDSFLKIKQFLEKSDFNFIATQGVAGTTLVLQVQSSSPLLLVNEMGFLSELYSKADWAYVGGGFGAGIHSTIEPAIHGIPIAIGPQGAEKFSEVNLLQRTGQLTLVENLSELRSWVANQGLLIQNRLGPPITENTQLPLPVEFHSNPPHAQNKTRWRQEAESRCGGALQILYSLYYGK